MKHIQLLLLTFLCCINTFSCPADTIEIRKDSIKKTRSKIYHVNYFVTGAIIGVGMVSDFFAIGRLKDKQSMTDEEFKFVNSDEQKNLINSIDRWALKQSTVDFNLWKDISDYGQTALFLFPSLLIIDKKIRKDWLDLLLMYVEGHTITFSFYNYSCLGPTFINRNRPITYYPEFPDDERKSGHNRNSFYSGHVASSAYSTFFMAKVYCDYHPEMGAAKYLLYVAAAIPPLVIGYARIRALAHFPSDDLVGLALGAVIGIVVPQIHKYPISRNLSLGLSTSPEVVGLSIRLKFPDKPHYTPGSLETKYSTHNDLSNK